MVFSSITFLFFFLPIFLLVFHLLPKKLKPYFLFISSLFFYFWGENLLVWILLTSTGIDYFIALFIAKGFGKKEINILHEGSDRDWKQKLGLSISIFSNLAFLAYFKYANFFIDNVIELLDYIGIKGIISESHISIALPLGISFYTFQSMSYTIDVYRGKVRASKSFIGFASYVTMFPQLVAGPIVRYSDIEPQINKYKVTIDDFVVGIKRFIVGLAKKVIIANTMASVADYAFTLPSSELSTGVAWLGIIAYTLQIYFDFSGYSDMAIGLGRMIGFTVPENFNYPYISRSIKEFWRRWHISLSTWFRDYLYFPLGGSKRGSFFTYRNLIIVFIVTGFWHGASWNFIVWGLFHGFFLILERIINAKALFKFPKFVNHLYALIVIVFSWVVFRADNLSDALNYYAAMIGFASAPTKWVYIDEILRPNVIIVFILGFVFSAPIFGYLRDKLIPKFSEHRSIVDLSYLFILVLLFSFSAMMLASGTYNPFIYFRF